MPPILSIENLGKKYLVGHQSAQRERYSTLRDVLARNAKDLLRKTRDIIHGQQLVHGDEVEEFWALKNVSFDVNQGEVVGIIGRNGAGKSTLLKILSRITEPTEGQVTLRGRVASLLEVGTGFHLELTGRENIFLNGAILGMKRAEIRRKFDEIVAFAEIEKFLDTPVKRYSSGMYVRLAFAVAAHLQPEILIVDEVLAVGDAEFQKKCLGKMESVSRTEGRTVLFVSHNLTTIQQLTSRTCLLDAGRLVVFDKTTVAVDAYTVSFSGSLPPSYDVSNAPRKIDGTHAAKVQLLWFKHSQTRFRFDEPFVVVVRLKANSELPSFCLTFTIVRVDGVSVGSGFSGNRLSMPAGRVQDFEMHLHNLNLAPGRYSMIIGVSKEDWLGAMQLYDVVFDVLHFEVAPPEGRSLAPSWQPGWGPIAFPACFAQPS